ncbi:MAG: energy-coupling factor transporter transmembrane protein EcfT [Candidatus Bathyarchaeota archaeon]|nr:MAG: energy-coupling factor transporter transmembrane protein EcfT [Candidatus Bathyarchaeota archaeon]
MSVFEGFKFRKVSSLVHDLDPRVKFFFVLVLFVMAILFTNLFALLVLFMVPLPFVFVAKVNRQWLRSLRGALLLAVFIFATNFIFGFLYPASFPQITPPVDTAFEYLVLLERSISMTLRFVVLIASFSVFFLTTSPDHLGLALQQSHVPYEFCFAFTTAVRFVPVLADEAQTIMDAQKARGLELERGNLLKRVRNYIPILIPLIVNAIRRSLELAEAMESRAWGASKNRTNLYALKLKRSDYVLVVISVVMLIVAVYIWLNVSIPSLSAVLFPAMV